MKLFNREKFVKHGECVAYKRYSNRKLMLVTDKVTYELGKTKVLVKFKDGKEMSTTIYGDMEQYITHGNDEESWCPVREPEAYRPIVISSHDRAKQYIQEFSNGAPYLVVDDPQNPSYSYQGEILSRQILETEKYSKEFEVYRVVPNGK